MSLAANSEKLRTLQFVLTAIRDLSPGRRKLLSHLRSQDVGVSEYHLRSLLGRLSANNLITYGKGRAGCKITMKGEELLRRIG